MDTKNAISAFAALAQESRLAVFRLLVTAGPAGMPAMKIAQELGARASSMSFHLKELTHAGLVTSRQEGRFVFYAANVSTMNALLAYLLAHCCEGEPCSSGTAPATAATAAA